MRAVAVPLTLVATLAACGDGGGASDAGGGATDAADVPTADAAAPADAAQLTPDAYVFDPGPEPTVPIVPAPGEVTVLQLDLAPGVTFRLGEAAVIVGPTGQVALLDVGNSNHDDEVRAALTAVNALHPERDPLQVEWLVLTHIHGDHVGAFANLLVDTAEPLLVTKGIVHRGFVDLGAAMNPSDYEQMCPALRGTYAAVDTPLCESAAVAPCTFAELADPHAATGCPGLPFEIDLGGGATITLIAADGHVTDGDDVSAATPFGHDDSNTENARSLGGILRYGSFRYHFGGDMTGSGDAGEPDVESHLVSVAATYYGALGVDVAHVHHHARRTSSNATLVDALAPADGRSRNAIAGINGAHINSPHGEVLAAWLDGGRLADGWFWVTTRAAGGDTHDRLVDADGPVILQTIDGGLGYRLQAAGAALFSQAYPSVR